MKKLLCVLAVVSLVLLVSTSSSMALGDIEVNGIYGDKNHHNVINTGDMTTVDVKNKNVNKNTNVNTNVNTNINTNRQSQDQSQGQSQGQMQGQLQGQMQGQSADNKGNHQTINQNFEDKRDHAIAVPHNLPDPKFGEFKGIAVKAHSDLLSKVKSLDMTEARKLSDKTSDIKVDVTVLFENEFETTKIFIDEVSTVADEFMGYLYVLPTGDDCNATAMIGKAAVEAMRLGATSMVKEMDNYGAFSEGTAWNVGLGGGGSILTGKGDDTAVMPNGGIGYGSASATNELRPAYVFALYFDPERVVEKEVKGLDAEHYRLP